MREVRVVERVAQVLERRTHRLPGIVQHRHSTGELPGQVGIEDQRPARDEVVTDDREIDPEAGRSVLVRHRIRPIRVVGE